MAILRSSITRRDAKTYLSQFDLENDNNKSNSKPEYDQKATLANRNPLERIHRDFIGALDEQKLTGSLALTKNWTVPEPKKLKIYRVIIIKLVIHNDFDEKTLESVASALSHAMLLGIRSVVIIDYCDTSMETNIRGSFHTYQNKMAEQVSRLTRAILRKQTCESIFLNDAFDIQDGNRQNPDVTQREVKIVVNRSGLIKSSLRDGKICIIGPTAFSSRSMKLRQISADNAMVSISHDLSDTYNDNSQINGKNYKLQRNDQNESERYSIERIILVDPLGGIPIPRDATSTDEFINLEEEYRDIISILKERLLNDSNPPNSESDVNSDIMKNQNRANCSKTKLRQHIRNLELVRNILDILPSSSSALIASPAIVSTAFSKSLQEESMANENYGGAALIHNFLTNKPPLPVDMPSSNLLGFELNEGDEALKYSKHSSFIRSGTSLRIFPRPKTQQWSFALTTASRLNPMPSNVNMERVRILLENSFGRNLDMSEYFRRIQHNLAGIVIAGNYSGCAILTWERVEKSRYGGHVNLKATNKPVPYLDKFAVAKHCQGESGLAGVIFSAIKNELFGRGFVWRSRKTNIVNKWYFGRSVGTWKLPNSEWTMFWTTSDVERDAIDWQSYFQVCSKTKSSWGV